MIEPKVVDIYDVAVLYYNRGAGVNFIISETKHRLFLFDAGSLVFESTTNDVKKDGSWTNSDGFYYWQGSPKRYGRYPLATLLENLGKYPEVAEWFLFNFHRFSFVA